MVRLAESVEAILDAMVTAISVQTDPGGTLEDLATVVRGDRARPMPKLPSLWVVPEPATNDQTTLGLAESWKMRVRLAALVKDDDPDAAGRTAVRLAADARAAVLGYTVAGVNGRRLGLAYVNDVITATFDASSQRSPGNRTLVWSEAVVEVRWRTDGT